MASAGPAMDPNVRWLGVGASIRALGLSLIGPFLALYLRNVLGLGYADIGAIVLVVAIPPLLVYPLAGFLTDRLGRRRIIVLALSAEAASMLGTAYFLSAGSLVGIAGAFAVVSTMASIAGPAISAYVADFAHGSDRTRGYTWIRVGWNAGFTVGVLLGGALLGLVGFVAVTLSAGAFLAAGTTFVALVLEPSPYDRRRARPTPLGRPIDGVPGSISQSVRLLARDRPFLIVCLSGALATLTINQWSTTFPLFVNTVLGIPYALLGVGFAINGILVVFGQTEMTKRSIGHAHTSLAIVGTLLYVAAFLLLGAFGAFGFAVLAAFFASVIVLTTGENLTSIFATTLPSNLAPASELGAYNGAFFAITGVGSIVAPLFGGLVLAATTDPLLTWAILVVPAIPAVLLLRTIAPRLPAAANRA